MDRVILSIKCFSFHEKKNKVHNDNLDFKIKCFNLHPGA